MSLDGIHSPAELVAEAEQRMRVECAARFAAASSAALLRAVSMTSLVITARS